MDTISGIDDHLYLSGCNHVGLILVDVCKAEVGFAFFKALYILLWARLCIHARLREETGRIYPSRLLKILGGNCESKVILKRVRNTAADEGSESSRIFRSFLFISVNRRNLLDLLSHLLERASQIPWPNTCCVFPSVKKKPSIPTIFLKRREHRSAWG